MSQVANTSPGNRYLLTARSLMPNSALIGWAIVVACSFSVVATFYLNSPVFLTAFLFSLAMGLGHMTCLFQTSERRRLVPGMNSTCALIAILIVLGISLVNIGIVVAQYGFVPEALGGILLSISFGLWLGWGERRIFHLLGLTFLALFSLMCLPNGPVRVYEFYKTLSTASRSGVGIGMTALGLIMLWRFWTLSTAKISPAEFKEKDDILSYVLKPRPERSGDSPSTPLAKGLRRETALASFSTRLTWMVYGRAYTSGVHYFWGLLSLAIIATVMVSSRGHAEATSGFSSIAFGLLAIFPTALFMVRVPQAFGRLWLAGISETRTDTARHLLNLTLIRMLPIIILIFALLLLQLPFDATMYGTVLFMMLSGLTLGGLGVWTCARWFVFWSSKKTVGLIALGTLVVPAVVALIVAGPTLVPQLSQMLEKIGWAPSLIGVAIVTVLVWLGLIFDSSRSLGSSKRLIECEVSSPQIVSVFTSETY
ncbi:MAG: hypothetical protein AB8B55_04235 [Mariniblastus sp.]